MQPRRYSRQYRLRSLLVVTAIVCGVLSIIGSSQRRLLARRSAVDCLTQAGCVVTIRHPKYKIGRAIQSPVELGIFDEIETVILARGKVTESVLKALTEIRELAILDLHRSTIAGTHVCNLRSLKRLRQLDLSFTNVGDADIKCLDNETLSDLNLSGCAITDEVIVGLDELRALAEVTLSFTRISDRGIEVMAASNRVKVIDLAYTHITDRGAGALASMTALRWLSIAGCNISDAGLMALAQSKSLKWLAVVDSNVSSDGIQRAKIANPTLTIISWGN